MTKEEYINEKKLAALEKIASELSDISKSLKALAEKD